MEDDGDDAFSPGSPLDTGDSFSGVLLADELCCCEPGESGSFTMPDWLEKLGFVDCDSNFFRERSRVPGGVALSSLGECLTGFESVRVKSEKVLTKFAYMSLSSHASIHHKITHRSFVKELSSKTQPNTNPVQEYVLFKTQSM